jgi:hypothetical protein
MLQEDFFSFEAPKKNQEWEELMGFEQFGGRTAHCWLLGRGTYGSHFCNMEYFVCSSSENKHEDLILGLL